MAQILSLEERLERPLTDGKDQKPREVIPLQDRITAVCGRQSDKYEKASREIVSLQERKKPARRGWFLDPLAPVDMLISSAKLPLDQIFCGRDLVILQSILSNNVPEGAPLTFLDAVCYIADEWEAISEWRKEPFRDPSYRFSGYELSADAREVWVDLYTALADVARRRVDPEKESTEGWLDISKSFPAAALPLPLLYQAAAECCLDAGLRRKISGMNHHFDYLFIEVARQGGDVRYLWSKQPVTDTSYMDLASTVYAAVTASNEKWIDVYERDQYLYELLITPFKTVRDIHRAEQAETM